MYIFPYYVTFYPTVYLQNTVVLNTLSIYI